MRLAVELAGRMEYGAANQVLEEVGQISISSTSIWRQVGRWGERFVALENLERGAAMALPGRDELLPIGQAAAVNMGVAMDGAMVHIRGEGWKELKVGAVFEIGMQAALDRHTNEYVELAHAVNNSYTAHLGGPERFGQDVWREARRRGWFRARETIALGDGAAWIWNQVDEHFSDSRQLIDWYHASQHLASAANLYKGDGTPAAHQWRKEHQTPLFQGHAERIAGRLREAARQQPTVADGLRREAGYFADNQRRMNYLDTREDGFPIGSGMVESACKQFRARFTAAGMRWSRPGIERLLPIRAAILSNRFPARWAAVTNSPPN